jgi:prolyl-tRNA editing enzyme YbaK/EbsC (Cys-tRNA(Pro) deacylase)
MTAESAQAWLAEHAPDLEIINAHASTATVLEAAATLGVEPGRIAKSLAIRLRDEVILLVTRGDARLDNAKTRQALGARPRMLGAEETLALTGHQVGGVCPFGLAHPLPVYLDVSLKDFDEVFPAAGSRNSSVRAPTSRLAEILGNRWIDVCTIPG